MKRPFSFVYIVDDDASVRRSLRLLLKANGFNVKTFARAADFFWFDHPSCPSCLLLDIRMPHISGLELQEAMAIRKLEIPIIFISGHCSVPDSVKAMKLGAEDFLLKPFSDVELLIAVERAITRSRIQNKDQTEVVKIKQRMETLTPRELEVFHFVVQGMLNKQIASKRGTSLQTIKVHRARVMRKMQARTVAELIAFAQKADLIHS